MADSYLSWWQQAGFEMAVDDAPFEWLAADAVAREPLQAAKPAAFARNEAPPPPVPASTAPWPSDIAALQSAIAAGEKLPGNMFGRRYAAPIGETGARLMIVSDLPDGDELEAGQLGAGSSGRLLKTMLAARGIDLASCYWTALATTAPAAGELPESEFEQLVAFTRHQIGLVKPTALLVLGAATSRAMLGIDLFDARGSLRDINHDGGNKAVLTSFHPRTLLAQPNLKAKAWEDLQMLSFGEAS